MDAGGVSNDQLDSVQTELGALDIETVFTIGGTRRCPDHEPGQSIRPWLVASASLGPGPTEEAEALNRLPSPYLVVAQSES